jgi:hypothetical protein
MATPNQQNAGVSPADPNTELLMHMDGANGGMVFTDECGHATTPSGDVNTETQTVKFGTAAASFDGNTRIYLPNAATYLNFGTSDWTIDFWMYPTGYVYADRHRRCWWWFQRRFLLSKF